MQLNIKIAKYENRENQKGQPPKGGHIVTWGLSFWGLSFWGLAFQGFSFWDLSFGRLGISHG